MCSSELMELRDDSDSQKTFFNQEGVTVMATTFSREDVLAQRLRSCYQLERNIVAAHLQRRTGYRVPACWDIPRKRANSMQRASVWHKLARFCDKQKFNPFQLIRWAVSVHRLGFDRPP